MPNSVEAHARITELLSIWAPKSPVIAELQKFLTHPSIASRWAKAPASSRRRYHHAYDGGLLVHTVDVLDTMTKMAGALATRFAPLAMYEFSPKVSYIYPQFILVAVLHDISKVGDCSGREYYVPNHSEKTGKRSEAEPYRTSDTMFKYLGDTLPKPGDGSLAVVIEAAHLAEVAIEYVPEGELSLALVRAVHPLLYTLLDPDVIFAIRWHDGAYGPGKRFMGGKETPLQMLLHSSDMWSSRMQHEELRA